MIYMISSFFFPNDEIILVLMATHIFHFNNAMKAIAKLSTEMLLFQFRETINY